MVEEISAGMLDQEVRKGDNLCDGSGLEHWKELKSLNILKEVSTSWG